MRSEILDGARVVSVRGELDLATHERLTEELGRAAKGKEPIVVDLGECEFMDSTGVRALLMGMRDAGDSRFMLASPTSQVQRILDMTGLGKAVPVHASVAEAVEALEK